MGFGRRLAAASTAIFIVATAAAAEAREGLQMRLGQAVAPPPGYQGFCAREPRDCPPGALSGHGFWAAAFSLRRPHDAFVEPPSSIRAAPAPRWRFRAAAGSAGGARAAAPEGGVRLTTETWTVLEGVNRRVNRGVASASDWKVHGRRDYWALPLSRVGRASGDCEDYVMEKRHQLLAAGFAMTQLSVALVRTRWGDVHAVLLVETDQGVLALDNRSASVRPWWKLKDRWIMRQSPEDPSLWVKILAGGDADRQAG